MEKWFDYFFQFLLTFLAVFLGFWAEKKRESIGNIEKAKLYLRSLAKDLNSDLIALNRFVLLHDQQEKSFHIIINDFSFFKSGKYSKTYYHHLSQVIDYYLNFEPNNATILQLKSSDGMSIVFATDQTLFSLIVEYEILCKRLLLQQSEALYRMKQLIDKKFILLNQEVIDRLSANQKEGILPVLLTKNGVEIDVFYGQLKNYRGVLSSAKDLAAELQREALKTLEYLKTKHNIKLQI